MNGKKGNVPAGFRGSEFTWKPAEAARWKKQYMTDVAGLWSGKHRFKSIKKGWRAVGVDTTVKVVEANTKPHFIATVAKYPPDAAMVQSSICPSGTHHQGNFCPPNPGGAGHGTASLDSNDMRPEQKLDWGNATTQIPFGVNQTGQTAAEGAVFNMDLARKRTAALVGHLTSQGIRADRVLVRNQGEKQTQDPALHETGHMLGLDDEYTTPGVAAGSAMPAGYDAMIKGTTGDVVTHGSTESAMSMGSTVQKWHSSSFLEALRTMSGTADWGI